MSSIKPRYNRPYEINLSEDEDQFQPGGIDQSNLQPQVSQVGQQQGTTSGQPLQPQQRQQQPLQPQMNQQSQVLGQQQQYQSNTVPISPIQNVNNYSQQPSRTLQRQEPPLVSVNSIQEEVFDIQPVINRERQVEFHRPVIQQSKEVVMEPEQVQTQNLPATQHLYAQVPGVDIQQQLRSELGRYAPLQKQTPLIRQYVQRPPVINETVIPTLVEDVQPVIEREVHRKRIIQQQMPVYDIVYENPVLLPTVLCQQPLATPASQTVSSPGTYAQSNQGTQFGPRYSYGTSKALGGGQQPLPGGYGAQQQYNQSLYKPSSQQMGQQLNQGMSQPWQQTQPLNQPLQSQNMMQTPQYGGMQSWTSQPAFQPSSMQQPPLSQPTAYNTTAPPKKTKGLQKLMPKKKNKATF